MRMRATVVPLLALSFLMPAPGLVPGAAAQEAEAPPLAGPGGAEIDVIPPDAIVLSLKESIRMALENNLQIAVSRYNPKTSEALAVLAESAFDPLLSGSITSAEFELQGVGFIGPFAAATKDHLYNARFFDPLVTGGSYEISADAGGQQRDQISSGTTFTSAWYDSAMTLRVKQPLLRNLGLEVNRSPIIVAQNDLGISESAFRQTVLDTVSVAVKDYADLNFAIMQLRTARFSLKLAQDFLAQNRIKVRVGTLAPIEITQAEAQVADREESVIVFEAALRAAEDRIRADIGMRKESPEWNRPVRPSDPLILEPFEPNEEAALEAAFANRPDLEQARLDLKSRETELRARKNQRRWGLDFDGSYGYTGFSQDEKDVFGNVEENGSYSDSRQDLKERDKLNWSAMLTLSVPIGNRLALSNYSIAESNLGQSQYRLALAEQAARLEVRSAVRAVETNLKRVKASQVNVRLQREKLEAEQKKFENGMSTSFQVLQFQDDLSNSETRENLSKVDYNKSLAELERVKGTLLGRFGITLQGEDQGAGGGDRSVALRSLWRRSGDAWQDPGLRLGDRTVEAIRLPTDFVFEGGRPATSVETRF